MSPVLNCKVGNEGWGDVSQPGMGYLNGSCCTLLGVYNTICGTLRLFLPGWLNKNSNFFFKSCLQCYPGAFLQEKKIFFERLIPPLLSLGRATSLTGPSDEKWKCGAPCSQIKKSKMTTVLSQVWKISQHRTLQWHGPRAHEAGRPCLAPLSLMKR